MIEKLNVDAPVIEWAEEDGVDDEAIRERLYAASDEAAAKKAEQFGETAMRDVEKQVLLQTIDAKWREHLLTLEHLRSVVGFRGYAQRDPLNEYKTEGFQLFEGMLDGLREDVTQKLGQVRPMSEEEQARLIEQLRAQQAALAKAAEPAPIPESVTEAGFDEGDPATVGESWPERPVPLRLGQEVQALPRPDRLNRSPWLPLRSPARATTMSRGVPRRGESHETARCARMWARPLRRVRDGPGSGWHRHAHGARWRVGDLRRTPAP